MDIQSCNNVPTLVSIKNECIRYKHKIKTKDHLVSLFLSHNINCNLIPNESSDIDTVIYQLDVQLMKSCNHCWIQEWIDTSFHQAKLVTYCEYCELTQN